MLKRCEEAIKEFREVLGIQSTSAASYINIASCLVKLQKYSSAIEQYLKAFEFEPDWMIGGSLNHEFGFTYVKIGEFDKARDIFKMMLDKETWKKARGHRSLALLDMYLGKYSDAIEHLNEAIRYNHLVKSRVSEVRDRLYLAAAYKTKANDYEFFYQIKEVIKIFQEQHIAPNWLLKAGKLCYRMQKLDLANQIYSHINNIFNKENLDDRVALNILRGEMELIQNNIDKAIEFFQMAVTLKDDIYNLESLAYAFLIKGDFNQAINKYEQLIGNKDLGWEGQEYWIHAHYQLAKIFEQKGETEKAKKYYNEFINIWANGDQDLPDLIDARKRLESLM
jgi:tetratricopeptide (TPR) repeat protein